MKLILAHGHFDILHVGHIMHLEQARSMGDCLVVSLTADAFVTKPGRPIFGERERAKMLQSLRIVDEVYICRETTGAAAILRYRPALFVKGIDYTSRGIIAEELRACHSVGAEVFYTDTRKYSSSELVRYFAKCAA